jgi:predicted amidophosphoribosyltransferase
VCWAYESVQQFGTYYVQLPLWPVAFVAGAACLWLILRWPKAPYGRCAQCGYDLTGIMSGVCPECGTSVAHEEKKK